ncbi:MAG: AraC family transcriptional regulator ligand-binding domain-containing protein [Moritella sp.]|uniref:AraC family transcriptional regulator n=1 Tax=Moritella sp. TaxID=78556 RepID=UPI0029AD03D2|nr:AraC family transcriptional regulator ligand-binding domain-containing protein [Moritella sp.]MDX2320920.1 AraC family transcriptional regulator ligand-binding domain-containing protein [Moritella sp.]
MDGQGDVIGGWLVALYKALLWKGIEPFELLSKSEININEISNVGSRVPVSLCNKLFEQSAELTDDPLLPIKVSQCIVATTFHALGYALQASSSLQDAFTRLVHYDRVLSSTCRINLSEDEAHCYLELNLNETENNINRIGEQLELTMLLSIIKICRDLSNPGFTPVKIYTTVDSRCRDEFEAYTGCSIEFNANKSMLIMDRNLLARRLPNFAPDLILLSDKAADDYLAGLSGNNVVCKVRSEVVSLMATGVPNIDLVAEKLNFSQRSLQRKLNDSGTSYKDLVENIRQSMAEKYLNQNLLSLGEISYLLGFSNVANFSRAFKRWKGVTPGVYRGEHCHS